MQVDLDKLENLLNTFTSLSGNKRWYGFNWPGWLSFPPEQTPAIDAIPMKAVLRSAASFPLFITLYFTVCTFVIVTAFAIAILLANLHHHLHHLHWRLIKLLYSFGLRDFLRDNPPLDYAYVVAAMSGLGFGFISALRWAWNRRADRLNQEAALTPPVAALSSGVWPPPPTVPTDGNTMC